MPSKQVHLHCYPSARSNCAAQVSYRVHSPGCCTRSWTGPVLLFSWSSCSSGHLFPFLKVVRGKGSEGIFPVQAEASSPTLMPSGLAHPYHATTLFCWPDEMQGRSSECTGGKWAQWEVGPALKTPGHECGPRQWHRPGTSTWSFVVNMNHEYRYRVLLLCGHGRRPSCLKFHLSSQCSECSASLSLPSLHYILVHFSGFRWRTAKRLEGLYVSTASQCCVAVGWPLGVLGPQSTVWPSSRQVPKDIILMGLMGF